MPKASYAARSPSASPIPIVLLQSPMTATLLGIALLAPFVLKRMNRFKANED